MESPSPEDFEIEEEEDDDDPSMSQFTLSQCPQTFELSQSIPEPKATEKQRLSDLSATLASQSITSLSRVLLFKAFSGQAIDRRKCFEEALPPEVRSDRISNALLQEAEVRLRTVWGLEIKGVPDFMMNSLPTKYKDRFYVLNHVSDPDGSHSMTIHNQEHTSEEKGLLMVILALAFCKGTAIQTNAGPTNMTMTQGQNEKQYIYTARWISDIVLYRLLNSIDDTITEEPPRNVTRTGAGSKRKSFSNVSISSSQSPSSRRTHSHFHASNMIDIESKLEKFVSMDYLVKEKSADKLGSANQDDVGNADLDEGFCYAMGPRAALEIGRRQLIYFCADILGEQPDETMLAEINDEFMEEEEEEETDS